MWVLTRLTLVFIFLVILQVTATTDVSQEGACCEAKQVGEHSYSLVKEGMVPKECKNSCIYTRDDLPGSRFCFAFGDLPFSCEDFKVSGLLLAGGEYKIEIVEIWSPQQGLYCNLPPMKATSSPVTLAQTINYIDKSLVACGQFNCLLYKRSGWEELVDTLQRRFTQTSAVIQGNILLIGGDEESGIGDSTEWIHVTGEPSQMGISLEDKWTRHCSIQTNEDTIVLNGGELTADKVTEYSGIGGRLTQTQFPNLIHKRMEHACGAYEKDGKQWLLVTGGYGYNGLQGFNDPLGSTEVYDYSLGPGGKWREANPLPSPRGALRAASLGWGGQSALYIAGGIKDNGVLDEILVWNPTGEFFGLSGHLEGGTIYHAITGVTNFTVSPDWCHPLPPMT